MPVSPLIFAQNCCIEESWPGKGNIESDPMFVDPNNGDYRLQNGSPCIDRGLISAAPNNDINGLIRLVGDGFVRYGGIRITPRI